jgi:hypothetical protein
MAPRARIIPVANASGGPTILAGTLHRATRLARATRSVVNEWVHEQLRGYCAGCVYSGSGCVLILSDTWIYLRIKLEANASSPGVAVPMNGSARFGRLTIGIENYV